MVWPVGGEVCDDWDRIIVMVELGDTEVLLTLVILKSSSLSPASLASAIRWSTAFVEPPMAYTTATAFSKALSVRMSRALTPARIIVNVAS
jgi:hypothetical protein